MKANILSRAELQRSFLPEPNSPRKAFFPRCLIQLVTVWRALDPTVAEEHDSTRPE